MTEATITYGGKKITINSLTPNDNMLVKYFKINKFYEQRLLEKIKSLGVKGTYLDIGANIGNHSLYFGLFCPSTKVISIEPEKSIYEVLVKNMEINFDKPFETYNYAISDFDGHVSMTPIRDYNVGGTHVIEDGGDVECKTLDDLFGDYEDIALIKMDIEGHELRALTKAKKIIEANEPVIVSELSDKGEFNAFKEEITKMGYKTDGVNYANTPTYIWTK